MRMVMPRGRNIALGACVALALFVATCSAALVVSNIFGGTRAPSLLRDTAPLTSTQVYARGGQQFVVFYGTSTPFEATREHYRRELEGRGYHLQSRISRIKSPAEDWYYKVGYQQIDECASISEFTGVEGDIIGRAAEAERLRGYPHAFVVAYSRACGS